MSKQTADANEPYLIVAALWTTGDRADEVSEALHDFETPAGFSRGAAVSFKRDQADAWDFTMTMRKLNLEEINVRPCNVPASGPASASAAARDSKFGGEQPIAGGHPGVFDGPTGCGPADSAATGGDRDEAEDYLDWFRHQANPKTLAEANIIADALATLLEEAFGLREALPELERELEREPTADDVLMPDGEVGVVFKAGRG